MNSKILLPCRFGKDWLVLKEANGWGLEEFTLLYQNWRYLYLEGKPVVKCELMSDGFCRNLMPGNRDFDVEMSIENI